MRNYRLEKIKAITNKYNVLIDEYKGLHPQNGELFIDILGWNNINLNLSNLVNELNSVGAELVPTSYRNGNLSGMYIKIPVNKVKKKINVIENTTIFILLLTVYAIHVIYYFPYECAKYLMTP